MKFRLIIILLFIAILGVSKNALGQNKEFLPNFYLDSLEAQLQLSWPDNETINLVFHGHSVPSGYFKTPIVNTLESYPFIVLKKIKEDYPFAVVNSIVTAIGGEQSEQGAARFRNEVLNHSPDVVFIDYALNDRSIGLERAKKAWETMIELALEKKVKVVLLTPSPDLNEDINDDSSLLTQHSAQIRSLAKIYEIPVIDSFRIFQKVAKKEGLESYMAQRNHINARGHGLVAEAIYDLFIQVQ